MKVRENEGEWVVGEITITAGSGGGFYAQRCLERSYDEVTYAYEAQAITDIPSAKEPERYEQSRYTRKDSDATDHYFTSVEDLMTWLKEADALEALTLGAQNGS